MAQYVPLLDEDSADEDAVHLLTNEAEDDTYEKEGPEDWRYSTWHRPTILVDVLLRPVRCVQEHHVQSRELWDRLIRPGRWFDSPAAGNAIRNIWIALRPAVLSPPRKRKILSTSWLDGLRGLASFVVVVYHSGQVFYGGRCGAWYKDELNFFRLPIVRLQCSGTAMVDIFFVVSGYALSYKALSTIRNGDFAALSSSLASAIFRRGIRLYLPVAAITFINAIASYLQIFDPEGRDHVPYQEGFWSTMKSWLDDFLTGINPFHVDRYRSWDMRGLRYEPAMWTIPYEYRGSLVIFVVLLVMGRSRPLSRHVILLATVLYVLAAGQWDIFLFLSGTLCCQLHHILESRQTRPVLQGTSNEKTADRSPLGIILARGATFSGLLTILFVLTIPDYHYGLGDVPFYEAIVSAGPASWAGLPDTGRFPVCVAAALLVFYCGHSRFIRNALSARLPQYLGEISFSIYLVHFFLINTMGRPLMRILYNWKVMLGLNEGLAGAVGDWTVLAFYAALAMTVLCWCGEIVTRYVDKKTVVLARWMEKRCVNDALGS